MQEDNNNLHGQDLNNNEFQNIKGEENNKASSDEPTADPVEKNVEETTKESDETFTDEPLEEPMADTSDFSYHSDSEQNFTNEAYPPINNTIFEPQKKKNNAVIISLIAAGAIIILLFAVFCIAMFAPWNNRPSNVVDMKDENMTVIKNSPQITLSENTDMNYVPQSIPEVVKKVADSVVEISSSSVVTDGFFQQYVTGGAGSGVIITQSDEAGYLLTNYHVISGATEIIVRLTNGEEYLAQSLGNDEDADLSVLRIEKKNNEVFTVATLGNSHNLLVGQEVIAIGNPLGSLGGTVTNGIISALDREVKIDGVSMVLLQHNAAINPGNSGGGLFDAMGNLIGIVNAKTSKSGIEGLGFAIPINVAYNFFNRIVIVEPSMGIKVAYGSVNRVQGLYVIEKQPDSKFEIYDRILSINGQEVTSEAEYYVMISKINKGETAAVKVKRGFGTVDIAITFK